MVTSVAEVRQEKVRRPLLLVAIFCVAIVLQMVLFAVGLAFRLIISILSRNAGSMLGGGGGMGSMLMSTMTNLSGETMPVQPFRVTTTDGSVVECLLRGSIHGGSVELGDSVEVTGSWVRGGGAALRVTRLHNLTTGAVTSARLPGGVSRGDVGSLVLPTIAGVVVLLIVLSWLLR